MSERAPNLVTQQQSRFNRSTQDHWQHFTSHRDRIEQLLLADGLTGGGRLCVLGAGNCNDLDLPRLAATFEEVHLVDLDPAALANARQRQGVATAANVHTHAPIDLTGIAEVVSTWPRRTPTRQEIDATIERAATAPMPALPGAFDVVLSPCVLSQLAGYAGDTLGASHPRTLALRCAIRDRHLRLMTDLLKPGGFGVLVTDVISSVTRPYIAAARYGDLPELLRALVHQRVTYPALDPESVERLLRDDPLLAALLSDVQVIRPWVWTLGPLKSFLVYALRFRRSAGAVLLA